MEADTMAQIGYARSGNQALLADEEDDDEEEEFEEEEELEDE